MQLQLLPQYFLLLFSSRLPMPNQGARSKNTACTFAGQFCKYNELVSSSPNNIVFLEARKRIQLLAPV
jgi:hypothetical protein